MTLVSRLALLAALVLAGCAQSQAHPDHPTAKPAAAEPSAAPAAAPSAASDPGDPGDLGLKIDRRGSVEQQLRRLQDAYDRNAEAIDFLNKVYAQQKAQAARQERDEPATDAMFAVDVTSDIQAGQVDGPATAPVTIIKAFDFACPYCSRVAPVMKELVAEYKGKVRVVYTNMLVHPPVRSAHLASCAAAKQGKYLAFKDAWWDKGYAPYAASGGQDVSLLGEDNIVKIAKGVGLDTRRLKTDMESDQCKARLDGDMAELAKFHVNSTPTFFINGKLVIGALPKEQFKQLIDEQLKVAEASGVPGADYYQKVVLGKGEKQFRSKADPRPH
jgi:protein-disulfide isomerase